ncbi:hypothetical protein C8Q77DRAFT_334861 [Trametes polyzona]|nr:hypothetical protein C8Q77DRAFT_334861 [Trametes polyzona]
MLTRLPIELVALIIRALYRDVDALCNASLASPVLLPLIREELFRVMNVRALKEDYMRPYFPLVAQMQLVEALPSKASRHSTMMRQMMGTYQRPDDFLQFLDEHTLPNLKVVNLVDVNPMFQYRMSPDLFAKFSQLTSVTNLTLSNVFFRYLRQAQALICSLPNLISLALKMVNFSGSAILIDAMGNNPLAIATTRPRLTHLAVMSPTPGTIAIVEWLATGPSRQSITSLVVPHGSQPDTTYPDASFRFFGPSIEHLSVPLEALSDHANGVPLVEYTSLRSLSLFLGGAMDKRWNELAPLLEHRIPDTCLLHGAAICIRLDMATDDAVNWSVVEAVDDILSDTERYGALERVELSVQWREREQWTPRDGNALADLESGIITRMEKLASARKLVVHVGVVKETNHACQTAHRDRHPRCPSPL